MKSINPSFKLMGLFLLTLALAAARNPILNISVFVASFLLMAFARVSFRSVMIRMSPLILVALGLFMTGYRYGNVATDAITPGSSPISDPAILNGFILSSRVLAFAGLGFLFALTTDRNDLIVSLQQQFRLPAAYAFAIVAAWNLLPDLEREYRRTRHAFRARGLNPWPLSPAILKPMMVKAVLWSQALAMAMESRGFDGLAVRTEWRVVPVRSHDIVFMAACCIGGLSAVGFLS